MASDEPLAGVEIDDSKHSDMQQPVSKKWKSFDALDLRQEVRAQCALRAVLQNGKLLHGQCDFFIQGSSLVANGKNLCLLGEIACVKKADDDQASMEKALKKLLKNYQADEKDSLISVPMTITYFPGFKPKKRTITLIFSDESVRDTIYNHLAPRWHPKKIIALVNPYAGKKQGRAIFKICHKVFAAAGIELEQVLTQYKNFGYDFAKDLDLNSADGLLCFSGDSTLSEVLNGFRSRPDSEETKEFPIGLMACGSTNAVLRMYNALNPVDNSLRIIRGVFTPHDSFLVKHGSIEKMLLCNVGFGLMGDLNYQAERCQSCRGIGPLRYVFGTLYALCCMPQYRTRISYVPVREINPKSDPCTSPRCKVCSPNLLPIDHPHQEKHHDAAEDHEEEWKEIDVPLTTAMALNMKTPLSTKAHISDGAIDLMLVHYAGVCCPPSLWCVFPSAACDGCGCDCCSKKITRIQVSKFKFENMMPLHARLNLDGEVHDMEPDEPFSLEVLRNYYIFLGGHPHPMD